MIVGTWKPQVKDKQLELQRYEGRNNIEVKRERGENKKNWRREEFRKYVKVKDKHTLELMLI